MRTCWKLVVVKLNVFGISFLLFGLSSPAYGADRSGASKEVCASALHEPSALEHIAQRDTRERLASKARRKRPSSKSSSLARTRRMNPNVRPGEGRRKVLAPYSLKRIFRGFGKCHRGKQRHQAIDIGGVGKNSGLGTPIFAMARSKVTLIGLPEDDPRQFGTPEVGPGKVKRGYKGKLSLPKEEVVSGYGKVRYFTKDYGSWRAGVVLVTRALEGPLKGHEIRYMHMGAVHPTLKRGTIIEAGEEIGLMGGTAILESAPHVHIDITDPDGERVDVAPLLGLPKTAKRCPAHTHKASKKKAKRRSKKR